MILRKQNDFKDTDLREAEKDIALNNRDQEVGSLQEKRREKASGPTSGTAYTEYLVLRQMDWPLPHGKRQAALPTT